MIVLFVCKMCVRVRACVSACVRVCVSACVYACVRACGCQLRASVTSLRQLLHCAHNRIVNIMKVYIERNNMQVELMRFSENIVSIYIDVCDFARWLHASPQSVQTHCSKSQ